MYLLFCHSLNTTVHNTLIGLYKSWQRKQKASFGYYCTLETKDLLVHSDKQHGIILVLTPVTADFCWFIHQSPHHQHQDWLILTVFTKVICWSL